MKSLRSSGQKSRQTATRLALTAILAVAVAGTWQAGPGRSAPEAGTNGVLLAQSSPISPLGAVTVFTTDGGAPGPVAALLTRSELALPCATAVLLLMLAAGGVAYWRQP